MSAAEERVSDLLAQPGPFVLSAGGLAADTRADVAEAKRVLTGYVARGMLRVEMAYSCGCCRAPRTEAEPVTCPDCGGSDCDVVTTTSYVRDAPPTRSLTWVVVLHGMNTRGRWQEDLQWLVNSRAGHAVPIDVDKYGKVRPGALVRWRMNRLSDRVAKRLRSRVATNDARLGPRPDVIAHSLGTWLIAHALLRHPDLVVDRVILAGSVLRPDFDWPALIAAGRVEAVLDHRGGRDIWVPCAQYVIPDAGPSGRIGFLAGTVEREAPAFGHSDFFGAAMQETYDTVWRPFLTWPVGNLATLGAAPRPVAWRPRPWPWRAPALPLLVVAGLAALLLLRTA